MMVMSEKMHQRTCQQQIGQRGEGVTRMRRQQIDAERGHHERYSQPDLEPRKPLSAFMGISKHRFVLP